MPTLEEHENPGAVDKPSVLSVIVETALEYFRPRYSHSPDGYWKYVEESGEYAVLTERDVREDIARWVHDLKGEGWEGQHLASLVRAPGWGPIIAGRVIRELLSSACL